MNRFAIIIDAGNAEPKSVLTGTQIDTNLWVKYLQSLHGGAWYQSEISVLTNPSKSTVRAAIDATASMDFCLVAFSGHGYVDAKTSLTYGVLKDGDISEAGLTPGCSRSITVMDSCRQKEYKRLTEGVAFAAAEMYESDDVLAHRNLFDSELAKIPLAKYRLFGCDFGQVANEDSRGGFFTTALINAGDSASNGVVNIKSAFDIAKSVVQARERTQTPTMQLPRTMNHLPFGVSVARRSFRM